MVMLTDKEFLDEVIRKRPQYYESDRQFIFAVGLSNEQSMTKWKQRERVPDKWKPRVAELLNIDWLNASTYKVVGGENFRLGKHMPGRLVPKISTVSAGPWEEIADNHPPGFGEGEEYCGRSCSESTVAFIVDGDSMTAPYGPDSFPHGTTVFIDPTVRPENGKYVIAKINGDDKVTFKRFVTDGSKRYLRPLNPAYPTIEDEFRILGVLIGMQKYY